MILDGQNEIHRSLKLLVGKLDEIVGRQERELSLLTLISQQPHAPGGAPVTGQVCRAVFLLAETGLRQAGHRCL